MGKLWPAADQTNDDNFVRQEKKEMSFKVLFAMLAVLPIVYLVSFYIVTFMVTHFPGNKYYNGILLGVAELISMPLSGYTLGKISDRRAYQIFATVALCSTTVLASFPSVGIHSYLSLCGVVIGLGGMLNAQFILIEFRVPPQKLGSVLFIVQTLANGSSFFTPTIVTLQKPWPQVIQGSLILLALIVCCFLPAPGSFLPEAQQTKGNISFAHDKTVDATSNAILALSSSKLELVNSFHGQSVSY